MKIRFSILLFITILNFGVNGADWPMWRYDAGHTAASPAELPETFNPTPVWVLNFSQRVQVWDDPLNNDMMAYDKIFEPVVMGKRMFVSFNDKNKVVAFNTDTGATLWTYYADGPVRFPPVAAASKVYFVSDDGCLYCVSAQDGTLQWKFSGAPKGNKILGNERLISAWPARGGPVLRDGRIYFAASIWPFMGTFIYCIDASTGTVLWLNDSTGSEWIKQCHNDPAFTGVAPQGILVATKEKLIVPGGRSKPAIFNRDTGELEYFTFGVKGVGGAFVVADERNYYVHTRNRNVQVINLFEHSKNKKFPTTMGEPVLTPSVFYYATKNEKMTRIETGDPVDLAAELFARDDMIPSEAWKVSVDCEERRFGRGENAIDGRLDTYWHSSKSKTPDYPHDLVIDLGKVWKTDSVFYVPRQDRAGPQAANIKEYALYLSEEKFPKSDLGNTNVTGTAIKTGTFANTKTPQEITFPACSAQYVKIRALSGYTKKEAQQYTAVAEVLVRDASKTKPLMPATLSKDELWNLNADIDAVDESGDLILAGKRLYVARTNKISAVQLPKTGQAAEEVWSIDVDVKADIQRLIAADDKLFAVTLDGRIMAFSAGTHTTTAQINQPVTPVAPVSAKVASSIEEMIGHVPDLKGYCLIFGIKEDQLDALLQTTELNIIAVDPNPTKIPNLRKKYDNAGLYGVRVSLHAGTPENFQAPHYLADLIVDNNNAPIQGDVNDYLKTIFRSVRPYGGVVWFNSSKLSSGQLTAFCSHAGEGNPFSLNTGKALARTGALPGSGSWTHQYGDIENTVKSDDERVKLPLGVLWFGGSSNLDVLPRHAHGPPEQVIGGRLFIEGIDCLSARDVYTGRVLWKVTIPDLGNLGIYYDYSYKETPLSTSYNQRHIPGANARGSNFVATPDTIYVAAGSVCLCLDPKTGETKKTIPMPKRDGETEPSTWGFIGVYNDLLIGGRGFANFTGKLGTHPETPAGSVARCLDMSASQGLVIFNRKTGVKLWKKEADYGFVHNAIVAGQDRIYCLDKLPPSFVQKLAFRGTPPPGGSLFTFNANTGALLWSKTNGVFGTWLSYSTPHDVLIQAGDKAPDRLSDNVDTGVIAYQGATGNILWSKPEFKYVGPLILHNEILIANASSYRPTQGALTLLDGNTNLVSNPLTQNKEPWSCYRTYGCNTAVASEHLLTFRSGAAGFYDLTRHSGTGNLGGFKSGCTSNLIIADGLLNAPDYTRTCTCNYQNQTSLGLVHMPDIDAWTHTQSIPGDNTIRRLGLNFGAPGDRMDENGTLWLEFPIISGTSSPDIPAMLTLTGNPDYFQYHSLSTRGKGPGWITASGVRGITGLKLKLKSDTKKTYYSVRLYFSEPEEIPEKSNVFDITIQGKKVTRKLDVMKVAGASRTLVVKEYPNMMVDGTLNVEFTEIKGTVSLCGIEVYTDEIEMIASK